jgi:hypothetical protein
VTLASRALAALSALLIGCSSAASVSGSTTTGEGSTTAGSTATSAGNTGSGTGGGSTSGGISGSTTGGTTGPGMFPNAVNGPLGFQVVFAGLLYDDIPDAGPDLTNVDVRLTDGVESFALCPFDGAGDAGLADGGTPGPSQNAVDIYLINAAPVSTLGGNYSLVASDGGPYAVIYRSQRDLDSGLFFTLTASDGTVQCEGAAGGVAGSFQATFSLDGGGVTLIGTFNVPYCGAISGS